MDVLILIKNTLLLILILFLRDEKLIEFLISYWKK